MLDLENMSCCFIGAVKIRPFQDLVCEFRQDKKETQLLWGMLTDPQNSNTC